MSGQFEVSPLSVEPLHGPASADLFDEGLNLPGWRREELDSRIPVAEVCAGAWHLVIGDASAKRLACPDHVSAAQVFFEPKQSP